MKRHQLLTTLACALLSLAGTSSLFAQAGATNPPAGFLNADGSGAITGPASPAATLTWQGTATGGPSSAGAQIDGVNRDFFILTVNGQPADWAGKVIDVDIRWLNPGSDYDLEVHKGAVDGPQVASSGSGPPATAERVTLNPESQGTGTFYINALYFAVADAASPPNRYTGTAKVIAAPNFRSATYTQGGMTFSPNITTKTPTSAQDGEPSSRCDYLGNYYISGIRGVPAGNDLWYVDLRPTLAGGAPNPDYDPFMRNPLYRGQPDSPSPNGTGASAGALGGGDVDLAIGFGNNTNALFGPTDAPLLAFTSLLAADITSARISNKGLTIELNPLGNTVGGVPVNDREWQEAYGSNVFFLEYRNFGAAQAFISRSIDGGFSYPTSTSVGDLPQTGSMDVDQFDGTIYIGSNDGRVAIGTPAVPGELPLTFNKVQATPQANVANIFFVAKVADDKRNQAGALTAPGTVYVCFSNGSNIYVAHSNDKGLTWSDAVQVNDPADTRTKVNLLPWFETGPTEGSLGVVWYGTDNPTNDDNARWRVFYAQTFNAKAAVPEFRIVQASDHTIHGANISLSGLAVGGESPNRNLIDYFQIAFDPTGAAVIGYTDDHNDFQGHTYVTLQMSGPSINGGTVPVAVEGANVAGSLLPENRAPGPDDPQVFDFAQDQDSGLVVTTPSNSPADILSIKYNSLKAGVNDRFISATMTVSELAAVPPNGSWRMHFTANAPEATLNASGTYSNGISDRGDQFYVEAVTDPSGVRTFRWGTAVRNFSGGLDYTDRGAADRGFINTGNRTITVLVATSKLNGYLATLPGNRPQIVAGSVICGLRGSTSVGAVAVADGTRGGTQFVVRNADIPAREENAAKATTTKR